MDDFDPPLNVHSMRDRPKGRFSYRPRHRPPTLSFDNAAARLERPAWFDEPDIVGQLTGAGQGRRNKAN